MSTFEVFESHPYPYGHGWRWVEGYKPAYRPSDNECFYCSMGGPQGTPTPSGEPVAYTVYRKEEDPYAHYSCQPHLDRFKEHDHYRFFAVKGIWKPEPIVDLRGLPVDRGHLHPKVKISDVYPPSEKMLAKGAMAATLGLSPCPWCLSKCKEDSYLAVCEKDPSHIVQCLLKTYPTSRSSIETWDPKITPGFLSLKGSHETNFDCST